MTYKEEAGDEKATGLTAVLTETKACSLENLAKNRTTFVIAHRLTTIRNAQRILVLTDQGIEEEGSHEELLAKKGIYESLYHMHL